MEAPQGYTGDSQLRGKLLDQTGIIEEAEQKQVDYLTKIISPLARDYGGFGTVLGGDSPLSFEPRYTLDVSAFSKDPRKLVRTKRISITKAWNTEVDLDKLAEEKPDDNWKFYLSLELKTDEQKQQGQAFFGDLLERAREKKISLRTKSFEHNYDSIDLYTWHKDGMTETLQELYPKYAGIWLPVHHFFQGPIPTINPNHIGYVQEPLGGHNGSHSDRMRILGKSLDTHVPVSLQTYRQACAEAGVKATAPWLIAA